MSSRERLRRTAFLCIHTLANVACFRAGCDVPRPHLYRHFFGRAHNNFLDIAVIKWCKVFADPKAKHYSFDVVANKDKYTQELLAHLKMSKDEFDRYGKLLRKVRDKFVAHLDDEISASMPKLDTVVESASFLLLYLIRYENQNGELEGVPMPPDPIYDSAYRDAYLAYGGEPETRYSGGRSVTEYT